MQDKETFLPFIQTKLHRPVMPVDLVSRPQLTDWLDERHHRRLTLVSAPAGYGKSTLISSWLDHCNYPHTWLTLDEGDNDLSGFLNYFLEAIHIIFPDAVKNSQALLAAPTQPPIKELIINLVNEINLLDQFFVLVLDDFEVIQENEIHDFLNEFLLHSPQNFHLVLCTRMDPPLSIQKLRAQSQLTEIRAQDLRFSVEESIAFLENILDTTVDSTTIHKLDQQSEGWVTGLRLAALALRHRVGKRPIEMIPAANNQYVMDYLMSEILDSQAAVTSEWLVKTSVLTRFNAGLCEAVCIGESEGAVQPAGDAQLDGAGFLKWLVSSNLFTSPLDDYNRWVRYHHLFRDFLQTELTRRYDSAEIADLHARASQWFAHNGLINEALQHALVAGDDLAASQLVEQNVHALLNKDQWHILEKQIAQLPDDIIQQRPALLIAKAWVLFHQFALQMLPPILEHVETILDDDPAAQHFWGEVDFFWGHHWYWQGQRARSLELLERALERISMGHYLARGEAELFWALATQMSGQKKEAVRRLNSWLYDEQASHPARQTKLLGSLIFLYLLSGELGKADLAAQQVNNVAEKHDNIYILTWASYLRGYTHYFWNDLENAAGYFIWVVEKRHFLNTPAVMDSFAGLALTYQAMQQPESANATMVQMFEFAQETKDPACLTRARTCQARISLLQGDLTSAIHWLETTNLTTDAGIMFYWLDVPRITECRVLAAQGSTASLEEAAEKLQSYAQINETEHNTRQLIDILLLQALVYQKQSQSEQALAALTRAITLAEPCGWIRPFVEVGPEVFQLLTRLVDQGGATKYVGKILAAFETEQPEEMPEPVQPASQLVEPLTNRECEILKLLGKRLPNKEIAAELHITVGTVQQHLSHIYAKLNVKGRWQAVAKAVELNLF